MKRILSSLVIGVSVIVTASPLAAQTTISADVMKDWNAQRNTMMQIAGAMPEEKFGFKATPPQRSWGEQILHVAGGNVLSEDQQWAKMQEIVELSEEVWGK